RAGRVELGAGETPVVQVVREGARPVARPLARALGGAVGVLDRHVVAVQEALGAVVAAHGWSMQRGYDSDRRTTPPDRRRGAGAGGHRGPRRPRPPPARRGRP